jgi:hypothetical protein
VRDYDGDVEFLSIAGRDEVEPMRAFLERHDLAGLMPHLADLDGDIWARFGVGGQPTFVFVDAEGEVERVFGAMPEDELERRLDVLTGEG